MSTYNHETYDLQADVDAKFPKIWKKLTIDSMPTPQENPSAVLLGGQPGAGKSFGTQEVSNRLMVMPSSLMAMNLDRIVLGMKKFIKNMAKMLQNTHLIFQEQWFKKLEMKPLNRN